MNKTLHRLVFNRKRGVPMAVQESAGRVGGSAGGPSGARRPRRRAGRCGLRAALAGIVWALGVTSWLPSSIAQTLPLTPSRSAAAGQRPIVDAASSPAAS